MANMIFRGSGPAPTFEHGDEVELYGGYTGVIQHRRQNAQRWEYGVLVDSLPFILWVTDPKRVEPKASQG